MGSFCSLDNQNDASENDVKLPKAREFIFCTLCMSKDHTRDICPDRNEDKDCCLRRCNSFC